MKIVIIIFYYMCLPLCFSQTINTNKIIINEGLGIYDILTLGEKKETIKNRYGKSDVFLVTKNKGHTYSDDLAHKSKIKTVIKYGRSKKIYYYKKLELYMCFDENDLINKIYFTSEKYQTAKGLSIGESQEKAFRLYRQGNSPILQCPSEGIDIVFECEVVKEIRIYKSR